MTLLGNVVALLVLVAGAVAAWLAIAAWWNRQQPGIYWFMIHVGLLSVWSFVGFSSFVAESRRLTVGFGLLANGLSMAVTFSWFLFIVTYLGYVERFRRWLGGMLIVLVSSLYIFPSVANPETSIIIKKVDIVEWNAYSVFEHEPTLAGLVLFVVVYGLFIVGLGLIVRAGISGRLKPAHAGTVLVATFVPLLGGLLLGFSLVPDGVPLIQEATALSVVLYAVAFRQYDLFVFSPATEQIGIDRAFDELGAGVLISEDDGRIIRANRSCGAVLDCPPEALIGRRTEAVLSDLGLTVSGLPATIEQGNKFYRVTLSPVTDTSDATIGSAILFLDVTEQRLREQRLDVLNRVLRHNLRNDLQVIRTMTELLQERVDGQNREMAERAFQTADNLASTSDKARTVGQLIERPQMPTNFDVSETLLLLVNRYQSEFPDVSFTLDCPDDCLVEVSQSLELTFENLIENAAEHNDAPTPSVEITVTDTDREVLVTVRDNGPGIDSQELAVIREGRETKLQHGSGMGLWAIQWAVDNTAATISYDTGPNGTEATVRIPR